MTVYIYEVRYKQNSSVISDLKYCYQDNNKKWIENQIRTKQNMIKFLNNSINSAKTMYYKNNEWKSGKDVRVINNSYLRTDANNKDEDNLGNLTTF